jgi:hypothetical protein
VLQQLHVSLSSLVSSTGGGVWVGVFQALVKGGPTGGVCADGRVLGWMWIMRDIEVLDFSGS